MTAAILRRAGSYEWNGRKLPSVTTILSTLAKPALVPWAARLVAERAVEEATRDTDSLDTRIACDGREATVKRLARAHWDASQAAKERGTAVHGIAELLCRGERIADAAVPADLRGYVTALHDFWREYDVRPIVVEQQVIDTTIGYAGTLDCIASVLLRPDDEERTVVVLDYKTRLSADKCALYPETALQLAAYAYGTPIAIDGTDPPALPEIAAGLCVSLHPEGYVAHVVTLDKATLDAFVALVRVYEWMQAQKPAKKKNGG